MLSWHGREDTLRCVESLLADTSEVSVLVVDNGSFDGVLEEVTSRWPQVETVQTGENLGFAGGMNVGIGWALEREASFVTVLNNDTIVPPGAIRQLQEWSSRGRAVTPQIDYLDDPDRIWFGQGAIAAQTLLPHHVAQHDLPQGKELRASAVLTGCCITAPAEVWRMVGVFDERFFLNFEDSEWSIRARRAGIELCVAPSVRIRHKVSAAFGRETTYLGAYYYARNGLLFNRMCRGSVMSRWRFLRRHVIPALRTRFRESGARVGWEATYVAATAVGDYLLRRFGRVRPGIEALDRRRRGVGT